MSKDSKLTAYIINHAHWDREWRYPLWKTRLMLVEFIDELIENLENCKYKSFLLDGQVIPILDYLEMRPEMESKVKKLISSGQLEVGPWYTLPDEFPVDGEALVRNLLWGTKKAKELGKALKIGYTSFGWGQTAQLPQIYSGFGIDVAMIGKRVNSKRAPKSEFLWQGMDGTTLLTTRFGEWGRQNFYFMAHLSSLFGKDHLGDNWQYNWEQGGIVYHSAEAGECEQDMFRLDPPDRWYPEYLTEQVADRVWSSTDESVLDNIRLMMNGCDYAASQSLLPEMIDRLNTIDDKKNRKWVQSSLTDFIEIWKKSIDQKKLCLVKGELRDGPAAYITGNALNTRNYIKRLNNQAQNKLIKFAEPMMSLASMFGAQYQEKMLNLAWKNMLESHAHDSINGVTQDVTADAVVARLSQTVEISEAVSEKVLQFLIKNIDMSNFPKEDILLVVINSLPFNRNEVIEAWIDIPHELVTYPMIMPVAEGLQICDYSGNPVSTQWIGSQDEKYPVHENHTRTHPFNCKRHRLIFDAGGIPAGGYKIFKVGSIDNRGNDTEWSDSIARTGDILKAPNVIENEFLRVEFNSNGAFDLTDKKSGRKYNNLNYYEDSGEHGDYWINHKPMYNQTFLSLGCNARIWSLETGPLQAAIVSEISISIPQKGLKKQQCRGYDKNELLIRTTVTLKAGSKQVEVEVEFNNLYEDHCLRVMFPTKLSKASFVAVGGHFTVDERSIVPQGPDERSYWPDMGRLPMNSFVDISDGETGFAILSNSLIEYEVSNSDDRVLALNLLRAVRNGVCTELRSWSSFPSQKGGQCFGKHLIRYAIMPHKGNWQAADIPLHAELFNVPLRIIQTRKHNGKLPGSEASLFEISNTVLRFSALKKSEDRDTFIVRVYNPTNEQQKGSIKFAAALSQAWLTNLNEERDSEIDLTDKNSVPVIVNPQKIVTVEIKTALTK